LEHAAGRRHIAAPPGLDGHRDQAQASWVEFDPTILVELAAEQADDHPGLPDLLAACDRAGWTCTAYAQFVQEIPDGGVDESVILEADGDDYVIDLDRAGKPLGVELLGIAMSSDHASDGIGCREAARFLMHSIRQANREP
jgi:hypothetical protein